MPTSLKETIVASNYEPGTTGGRRMTTLANGWLVSALVNLNVSPANRREIILMVKKPGETTWQQLAAWGTETTDVTYLYNVSISSYFNTVYFIFNEGTKLVKLQAYDFDKAAFVYPNGLTLQEATESAYVTMTIDQNTSKLALGWVSKTIDYAMANLYYAEGKLDIENRLTLNEVEQVTEFAMINWASVSSASLAIDEYGIPFFVCSTLYAPLGGETTMTSSVRGLSLIRKDNKLSSSPYLNGSWTGRTIEANSSSLVYLHPEIVYVPKDITKGVEGAIWVAYSKNATSGATRPTAYRTDSVNLGVTFTTPTALGTVFSTAKGVSLTANKKNEVFILFTHQTSYLFTVMKIAADGTQTSSSLSDGVSGNFTTAFEMLYDPNFFFDFDEPLFQYRFAGSPGNAIKFTGVWQTLIIEGDFTSGQKIYELDQLPKYRLTTIERSVPSVTEVLNSGNPVTKTPISGVEESYAVSPEVWESMKFGEFRNSQGDPNRLDIQIGRRKFSILFEKRLSPDSSNEQLTKAMTDQKETFFPSIKKRLATIVSSKARVSNKEITPSSSFAEITDGVEEILNGKYETGIKIPSDKLLAEVTLRGIKSASNYPYDLITDKRGNYLYVDMSSNLIYYVEGSTTKWSIARQSALAPQYDPVEDFFYLVSNNLLRKINPSTGVVVSEKTLPATMKKFFLDITNRFFYFHNETTLTKTDIEGNVLNTLTLPVVTGGYKSMAVSPETNAIYIGSSIASYGLWKYDTNFNMLIKNTVGYEVTDMDADRNGYLYINAGIQGDARDYLRCLNPQLTVRLELASDTIMSTRQIKRFPDGAVYIVRTGQNLLINGYMASEKGITQMIPGGINIDGFSLAPTKDGDFIFGAIADIYKVSAGYRVK